MGCRPDTARMPRFSVKVVSDDTDLIAAGDIKRSGVKEQEWHHDKIYNTRATHPLTSNDGYEVVVDVTFTGAAASARVQFDIVKPDGTSHATWQSSELIGENGAVDAVTATITME